MRRYKVRPFGHSITPTRTVSLLMSLAAIWIVYSWVRQPATWQWLADSDEVVYSSGTVQAADAPPADGKPGATKLAPPKETVVPGPNDLDPDELADFHKKIELISDRVELRIREMPLYWRLMQWSRTQPLKDLEARADATTAFSQIWESPGKYRGKLIRLRMHVRRVLRYEAPENPMGLKNAYEIWGWTEDSKSFPYVVVVPELPPGLRVGPDVRGEIVFVGYFFKVLPYTAFDVARGAPLLLGRVRQAAVQVAAEPLNSRSSLMLMGTMAATTILAGVAITFLLSLRRRRTSNMLPSSIESLEASLLSRELPVSYGRSSEPNFDDVQFDNAQGTGWIPDRN